MPMAIHAVTLGADSETAFAVESPSSISFIRVGDERSLIAALQEVTPVGYIAAHRLDHEMWSVVNRVRLSVRDVHLVVGLEDPEPVLGARAIVDDRFVKVVSLPDKTGLRSAVLAALFEGRRADLLRRIEPAGYDELMEDVVRCILEQDLGSKAPPMRSIEHVAARCGTNRSTLWRVRQRHDLDLRRFIFVWVVALALRHRFIDGGNKRVPWLVVARRCGYSERPGLTDLLQRELGHGLRAAKLHDLWRVLDRLDSMLVGVERDDVTVV